MVSVVNLESGVDRTIRPHFSDFVPDAYEGPDHSTFLGATALLKRIRAVREARGEPCNLRVEHVGVFKGETVYGIRPYTPNPFEPEVSETRIDPRRVDVDHARAVQICQFALRNHPGVTLEDVLAGKRAAKITAARRACIIACWDRKLTDSKGALGRFFRTSGNHITRHMAYDPSKRKRVGRFRAFVNKERLAA